MISRLVSLVLLLAVASASGAAALHRAGGPTPVVLWHGMGDTCCNNSTMGAIVRIIEDELPGVYVHSVKVGSTEAADRNAGFFGNLNSHIDSVCAELAAVPELQGGANLMGFSQGGLFLRALVQRCPTLRAQTLVTFGSPHSGVARVPECPSESDFMCNWMRRLASRGVYSWYVRDHVVQAQYFKDPERLDQYLQYNVFLPDINADAPARNSEYRERVAALDKVVLVRFSNDTMIYPAASAWFGFVDASGRDVPLQDTDLYREDWLGLRELDEGSRLHLVSVEGGHMEIGDELLRDIVTEHFGARSGTSRFRVQS
ncbi:hypothetical protein H4R19_005814 [Coemansia spiralis]|nr:hypothetical protein H4R19_005814 [Coemansia spiralis]